VIDRDREHRFINDCYCEASKYLLLTGDLYPCNYDLNVEDLFEDDEHHLHCIVTVDSYEEFISDIVFRFWEDTGYEVMYEVLERL